MAPNFKISVHRNSDSLHLKLSGNFDGSSAFQLLNALKKNSNGGGRVLIHTACLKNIDPFGCEMFRCRLSELNSHGAPIIFIYRSKRTSDKETKRIHVRWFGVGKMGGRVEKIVIILVALSQGAV